MLLKENAQNLFNSIGTKADVCKQFKMQKVLRAEGHVLNKIYEKLQKSIALDRHVVVCKAHASSEA